MFNKFTAGENNDWVDVELKRYSDDLAKKREEAIKYLGDKWILKGGKYDRSKSCLDKK